MDAQSDGVVLVHPALFLESALTHVLEVLQTVLGIADYERIARDLYEPFEASFWLPTLSMANELLLLTGLAATENSPRT